MKAKKFKKIYRDKENQSKLFVRELFNGDMNQESLIYVSGKKVYVVGGFFPVFPLMTDDDTFKVKRNRLNPVISLRFQKATLKKLFPEYDVEAVLLTNERFKAFHFYDDVRVIRNGRTAEKIFHNNNDPDKKIYNEMKAFEGVDEEYAENNVEIESIEMERFSYYIKKLLKGGR